MDDCVADRVGYALEHEVHPCGCWIPLHGYDDGNGYRQISVAGKQERIHRLAYQQHIGPIPSRHVVDHVRERGCQFRSCINPEHLEAVTNAENIRRGLLPHLAESLPCGHGIKNPLLKCKPCRREHRIRNGETKSRRGPAAERTECPHGHPYDEENTVLVYRPDGTLKQRACRECGRERVRARRARLKGVMPNV